MAIRSLRRRIGAEVRYRVKANGVPFTAWVRNEFVAGHAGRKIGI